MAQKEEGAGGQQVWELAGALVPLSQPTDNWSSLRAPGLLPGDQEVMAPSPNTEPEGSDSETPSSWAPQPRGQRAASEPQASGKGHWEPLPKVDWLPGLPGKATVRKSCPRPPSGTLLPTGSWCLEGPSGANRKHLEEAGQAGS